tara:strand:+ start:11224 stop:12141 length:918 start_codon:yes stop_codon:yes gene_type:complete
MAAFTAIAAGVGLAATAVGTVQSFDQASKQKKAQREAERKADQMMAEARKKLEVNFADALSIQKEPYERQRDAMAAATAQALEAGVESERGGAATVGRVLAASNEAQGGIRDAQNQDLFDLEAMQAEEDSRLRDVGVQLDLGEVAGAQQAASEAEDRAAQYTSQGFQGAINAVGQAAAMAPLFAKTGGTKQANIIGNNSTQENTNAQVQSLKVQNNAQVGTAQVGERGQAGFVAATSDYKPTSNIYDGVDITPILNNPDTATFNAFMAGQDPKWARSFRKDGLGVQTKAGQGINSAYNVFSSIFN